MIKQKGMPQQNGGEVAARVADGAADIGMTLIAEIVPVKGVHVLGPLPPAPLRQRHHLLRRLDVGKPQRRHAGRAFIAALSNPLTRAVWEEAGFEVAT